MRGYCTATMTRNMPWQVTNRVTMRALEKATSAAGPFELFVRAQSDKGKGEVVLSETGKNRKRKAMADYPKLNGAIDLLREKGVLEFDEMPTHIEHMLKGVKINNMKLAKDVACEFAWSDEDGPGDQLEGQLRVGVLVCMFLVELDTDTEEEGLFALVNEHAVIDRHDGATIIHYQPLDQQVCFPLRCLTYVMRFLPSPVDRPIQGLLETDKDYDARLVRPWIHNRRQLWALRVSPAY